MDWSESEPEACLMRLKKPRRGWLEHKPSAFACGGTRHLEVAVTVGGGLCVGEGASDSGERASGSGERCAREWALLLFGWVDDWFAYDCCKIWVVAPEVGGGLGCIHGPATESGHKHLTARSNRGSIRLAVDRVELLSWRFCQWRLYAGAHDWGDELSAGDQALTNGSF